MIHTDRRILELALIGLETERQRVENELQNLREMLHLRTTDAPRTRSIAGLFKKQRRVSPNKGVKMSEEQKRKISQSMKAKWSERSRRTS